MKDRIIFTLSMSCPIAMFYAGHMASDCTPNWGWFFGASFVILVAIIGYYSDEDKKS